MSLPLIGTVHARVVDAAEVSIHGDRYIDALVEPEPALGAPALAGSTVRVRIAAHACRGGRVPVAGDRIRAEMLMGQVTAVEVVVG
jgi:N-formylglutamate amidohydrolase